MKFIIGLLIAIFCVQLHAQEQELTVQVSKDTILLGSSFQVKFEAHNIEGDMELPSLTELNIISGPNMSSSMQFVNGKGSQSLSYTYTLQPGEIGSFIIEPAYISEDDKSFETPIVEILVIPNPEGVIDHSSFDNDQFFKFPEFDFGFPERKRDNQEMKKDTTPKRVLKRI